MGVGVTGSPRRGVEKPLQLAVIAALVLLVFGAMLTMYVQSLSLPRCGTAHISASNPNPKPEEIRCRK
jgi:hypothetical protein